jgi:hypothetical protein
VVTSTINRPGSICLQSGQYGLVNQFGTYQGREATVTRGEPFPPVPYAGWGWKLRDSTVHSR